MYVKIQSIFLSTRVKQIVRTPYIILFYSNKKIEIANSGENMHNRAKKD